MGQKYKEEEKEEKRKTIEDIEHGSSRDLSKERKLEGKEQD